MTDIADGNMRSGAPVAGIARHRTLPPLWRAVVIALTTAACLLSVNHIFNLGFLTGHVLLDNQYQYALVGLLVPIVFLIFPATAKGDMNRIPWWDAVLAVLFFATVLFFFVQGEHIVDKGWEMGAPQAETWAGYLLWLMVLEGTRRAGGMALFAIVVTISLYPLYADSMPGPISGLSSTLADTAAYHIMSNESILGLPMQALANLVIGFLIFGVALTRTGGGRFFIDLAFSVLGHVRGGPAKVAIFASGLMGSMSGSVISNVITTGVMTIPAMRRTGFRASYAAGVEACASTGGVLMPPVMGATAFIMAVFLNVPYIDIAIAAIVPSILFYLGLFMQIDAYAARRKMPGMRREDLPDLKRTLKDGWYFIFVFVLLIVMLVYLKREVFAPYYATVLLILITQAVSLVKCGWRVLRDFAAAVGVLLAEITAILAGVGLIVGALSISGMAGTLVNDLLFLAGGNTLVLLAMGALTSFVLGIGMTVTAAYIFLAIVLAPALIQGGLNPMAVHLFILYWGMVSYITPPVALGAYAAASVAGANAMRTGFEAMRLGSIIYFVPFFFVLDPAFILDAGWGRIVYVGIEAAIGTVMIAGALQGYLIGVGDLTRHPLLAWPARVLVFAAGLLMATPGDSVLIPTNDLELTVISVICLVLGALCARAGQARDRAQAAEAGGPQ
ncbi:MAG: TRAP transporter fused permease subunit [Rhodospirillales bacterium]